MYNVSLTPLSFSESIRYASLPGGTLLLWITTRAIIRFMKSRSPLFSPEEIRTVTYRMCSIGAASACLAGAVALFRNSGTHIFKDMFRTGAFASGGWVLSLLAENAFLDF